MEGPIEGRYQDKEDCCDYKDMGCNGQAEAAAVADLPLIYIEVFVPFHRY
jgi:hypothetical protein